MEDDQSFDRCSFCDKIFVKSRDEVFAFACPNCNHEFADWADDIDVQRTFQRSLQESPLTQAQQLAFGSPDWRPESVMSNGTFPAQNVNWTAPINLPASNWMRVGAVNRTQPAAASMPHFPLMAQSPQTPTRRPSRSYRGTAGSFFSLDGMTYVSSRSNVALISDHHQTATSSRHGQLPPNRRLFQNVRHQDDPARAQAQHAAHLQQQQRQQQQVAQTGNMPPRAGSTGNSILNQYQPQQQLQQQQIAQMRPPLPPPSYSTANDVLNQYQPQQQRQQQRIAQMPPPPPPPASNSTANSVPDKEQPQQAAINMKFRPGPHYKRMTCKRCGRSQPITKFNDGITCIYCLRYMRKAEEKKNSLPAPKASDAKAGYGVFAAGGPRKSGGKGQGGV